jgi:hypothetical protein
MTIRDQSDDLSQANPETALPVKRNSADQLLRLEKEES